MGVKTATYPSMSLVGTQPFFNLELLTGRKSISEVATEQYKAMRGEKMYGAFTLGSPGLVVNDPDIIKQILVKDFGSFVDRQNMRFDTFFNDDIPADRVNKRNMSSAHGMSKIMNDLATT